MAKTFYHKLITKLYKCNYEQHIKAVYFDPLFTDNSDKFAKYRKTVSELAWDKGKNKTVLEVATGAGWQAVSLKEAGFSKVIASDLEKRRIDYCQKNFKDFDIEWKVANLSHLPFRDGEFDVCVISAGLHDLPREVLIKGVGELTRVASRDVVTFEPSNFPRRFIWGNLYSMLGSILDESTHFRDFVMTDLDALFKKHTFELNQTIAIWHGLLTIKRYRKRPHNL